MGFVSVSVYYWVQIVCGWREMETACLGVSLLRLRTGGVVQEASSVGIAAEVGMGSLGDILGALYPSAYAFDMVANVVEVFA